MKMVDIHRRLKMPMKDLRKIFNEDQAWLIQQLLPYCTDNEDKDTLRNSDLL
jgi:hypothetical protein